ncbi:hypothetical protein LEP3755_65770 (plasmid) [Leptolyngbya sp. NIES-3755]|nr:hypothetical protein LEP3755_65770 [Leptolyngbya sp. NIES-3755]
MLKLESRTIHLQEFEIQLLNKLSAANGKTVEELLRDYVRAGLTKERHEGVSTYEKLKQEAALALLEAAESQAIAETPKRTKPRKDKQNDPAPNSASGQTTPPQTGENKPNLEPQFLELAEQFSLPEVTIEKIQPSESYLIRGKKQIRVITIQQLKDGNTAQYQLYNSADQKLHTVSLKSLTNNLRGPIPPHLIAQVNEAVTDSE